MPSVKHEHVRLVQCKFKELCRHINPDIDGWTVHNEWSDIEHAYGEPHRRYHTLRHIAEMLKFIDELKLPKDVEMELVGATIYHDFFYNTSSLAAYDNNEFLSAARAVTFFCSIGAPMPFVNLTRDRILATKTHDIDPKADPHGALLLDIDMGIIAVEPQIYREYSKNIRFEFLPLAKDDTVFYTRRRDGFILPTLNKKKNGESRIFMTDMMHDRFDASARRNLQGEWQEINQRLIRTAPAGP